MHACISAHQVVDHVSQGPGEACGDEGHAEDEEVQNGDRDEVAGPHAAAVHPQRVRVGGGQLHGALLPRD